MKLSNQAHLFLFHPLDKSHSNQIKFLSGITTLILSIISGGLFLIPFMYFQWADRTVTYKTIENRNTEEKKIATIAKPVITNPKSSQTTPKLEEPRFSLDHYLETKPTNSKDNPQFQKYLDKFKTNIQRLLSRKSWQKTLKNKSATQLFLDKVENLFPKKHPSSLTTRQYEWNSSTFASMEIARYLSAVLDSLEISDQSEGIIENWLQDEKRYLPFAIILDGMREENKSLREGMKKGNTDQLTQEHSIDDSPLQSIAKRLSLQLQNLSEGDSMKLLAGTLIHEVRVVIKKTGNNSFTVTSFDPDREETIIVTAVNEKSIQDTKFFKRLLELKFDSSITTFRETLFKELGGNYSKQADKHYKAVQQKNSCPVFAIMKEFKHTFLDSFQDKSEGLYQYKIIKSLMAEHFLETEKKHVDPRLFSAIEEKAKIRGRVLEWNEVLTDEERLKQAKEFYTKTFELYGEEVSFKPETAETFLLIDKKFSELLKGPLFTVEDKKELLSLISKEDLQDLPIGFIIKRNKRSDLYKEFLQQALNFHLSKKGKVLKRFSNIPFFNPLTNHFWQKQLTVQEIRSALEQHANLKEEDFYHFTKEFFENGLLSDNEVKHLIADRIKAGFIDEAKLEKFFESFDWDEKEIILRFISDYKGEELEYYQAVQEETREERINRLLKLHERVGADKDRLANIIVDRSDKNNLDTPAYIENIKYALENKILSAEDFQELIDILFEKKKVNKEEALELLQYLEKQYGPFKHTFQMHLLQNNEKKIRTKIENAFSSDSPITNRVKLVSLLENLNRYQPYRLVELARKVALSKKKSKYLVRSFFLRLYNLDPKPNEELKKQTLNAVADKNIAFLTNFITQKIRDPDFMNDAALHASISDQYRKGVIKKETIVSWKSKIDQSRKKRIAEEESNERIQVCTDAITSLDEILKQK